MSARERRVASTEALVEAAKDQAVERIVISGRLTDAPPIYLLPGQSLSGAAEDSTIAFVPDGDGVRLSADNGIINLRLEVSKEKRAIFNDTTLRTHRTARVTTAGCVQILARDTLRSGHVEVNGLDIIAADARGQTERPHGYGVHVLHGAFTLWNMQPNDVAISADLVGISIGRNGAPVRGSGVFCQRRW